MLPYYVSRKLKLKARLKVKWYFINCNPMIYYVPIWDILFRMQIICSIIPFYDFHKKKFWMDFYSLVCTLYVAFLRKFKKYKLYRNGTNYLTWIFCSNYAYFVRFFKSICDSYVQLFCSFLRHFVTFHKQFNLI